MRRQLLLLVGLSCAVVVAVLLRTAAADVDLVGAPAPAASASTAVVVAEGWASDCALTAEDYPGLGSAEAAQPLPISPLDTADQILVAAADSLGAGPALLRGLERPPRPHRVSRITIRPPPLPQLA